MSAEGSLWTFSGLMLAASGVVSVGILWYGGTVVPALGTLRETAPPWVRVAVLSVGAGLVLAGLVAATRTAPGE
jgi:hypothetical protein